MKFRGLEIDAYGRHEGLALAFPGDGLQMILGPNEAGKTTLLEFVRELLFGFADREHKYAFGAAAGGKIKGRATFVMKDGRVVEMERRKGRKQTVSGAVSDGRTLDERTLEDLLGGASEGLFRSVFAFGLEELTRGEKSLSDQSVKSVLFGAGFAGAADPKKVLDALGAEADKLYSDKATKKPVNEHVKELNDLGKRIREKSVRCDDYEHRRRESREAEARAAALRDELLKADRELLRRERLAKALAPWRELAALRRERAGLSAPKDFPADGLERLNALEKEAREQTKERDEALDDAAKAARDLDDLRFDPRPIDRRGAIEALFQKIEAVKQSRRDLPGDRDARDASLRDAADRLAALVPDWNLDDLRGFRLSVEDRDRLARLLKDRDQRDKALETLTLKRDRDAEELAARSAALDALGEPVDVSPWAALLADEAAYRDDKNGHGGLQTEHRRLKRELDALLPRLSPPLPAPAPDSARLPVPPRETVERFKRDFDRIDQRIETAASRLEADEKEAEALAREIAALSEGDIPRRDDLKEMRLGRDAGWRLVRRKFIDHQDAEAEIRAWLADHAVAPADLVAAFPETVARADAYADELFAHSSAVVKREQFDGLRDRIRRDREALAGLKADRQTLASRWSALWSACGFEPLEPDAMTGWLDEFDKLRGLQDRLVENEQEGRCARDRIDAYHARLEATVGRSATTEELIAAAREREQEIRAAAKSRGDLDEARRALADKIERNRSQAEALQAEATAADARRAALLRDLRLPESWGLDPLGQALKGLDQAAGELRRADDHAARIAKHETSLNEFDPAVAALAADVAPDLADLEPERAAAELNARLTTALTTRERRDSLEKTRAEKLADAKRREERLANNATERDGLLRDASVATAEEFRAVAERAAAVARLDGEIAAKTREFDAIRDADPLDEFVAVLEGADAPALEAARDDAAKARDRLQTEKSAAEQEVGSRRQTLSLLERGDGEAAELLEQAASRRTRLAEAVDRYVPLLFAHRLLSRAIERFEKEARPAMLQETSRLFELMTDGRYVRVDRPDGDDGVLQVRRHDDEILEPDQLSTGSREQLYLAVRLAYALHYCGQAEPLPIVMDDVLANFDDDRSRRTLRALDEVSREAQVLFLTCHPHVVELGREVFPSLDPITLSAKPRDEPEMPGGRRRAAVAEPSPSD